MASDPVRMADQLRFGDDFELDLRAYELRRAGRALKLERIPMELLLLLVEKRGQLVSREQIIERIWGKDVFLDTDNSINAAIRKIRQVLKDDPEQPRCVQTITARGYRFIAPVLEIRSHVSAVDLKPKLISSSAHPAEKAMRPLGTNLPAPRTGFIGREKELAAARELLLRPDVRLLTVSGTGGIGKTRMALELATSLTSHFSGGVRFAGLASINEPGLVASVLAQTFGLRQTAGQSPLEALQENLRELRAPLLLVLDNFEHLIPAAPLVADLLVAAPNLKVLATSRSALHIYGEYDFPIPPLGLPDTRSLGALESLSQCSAVALFVERAEAARSGFSLTRGNAQAVAEICLKLDGLPLAIELAAARVKVLSPASILTRLASRLQLLTGGARDLPERQQTLRAAMDWSYELLTPAEQKLFRRLAVFPGGCSLEAAEAVCALRGDLELDLLDGMTSLLDKSLLQQTESSPGEARFGMLETVREYALEKLQTSAETPLIRRAHAAYFLVLAEDAAAPPDPAESADRLHQLAVEQDNLRAAVEWLVEDGNAEWGLRLGAALFRFWETREHLAEGRESLRKLLALPQGAAPSIIRERAVFAAGVLAVDQGDYDAADALFRQSLAIAAALGDKHGEAVSLNAVAVNARDRGDLSAAVSLFENSLALWRELGDRKAIARSLSNLANVVKLQGDCDRARSFYTECLAIFEELGDRTGIAWAFNYQGDVARQERHFAAAQELYERGLAIFRELGDRWGIAGTLADLGSLAREQRNYSQARSRYCESLKLFHALGHKRGIARLLECFACAATAELDSERALRLAAAAAALRQNIGAPLNPAEQAGLDASLLPARHFLSAGAGEAAWVEGWGWTVEKAIEEALGLQAAPS